MLIAKFAYKNVNNINNYYIPFKFYNIYYLYVFYKEDINLYLKFKLIYILIARLRNLISMDRKNL